MSARVAPLGSRLVLLLVEDLTEARRIEAVRRDFVANVSHELKTPVGALSLLSEAVMDASDDPEAVQRFAGRMQIEATRLTNLVQELIDLSRVQNDDPLEDAEPVPVGELVAEAIDRCRHQAGTKEITMAAAGAADLRVWGNRGQLAAALGNLVENAVNYSPARTRVGIAVRSVAQPGGDLIEIAVTDQGIGISDKDKERIFERFYRVDPARSRATGGTGLGLAIVKHVAASHGGEVTVWSAEGQGSTFTLRLPEARAARGRRASERDGSESLDEEAGGTSHPPPHVRSIRVRNASLPGGPSVTRVLVVEDEESFSDALSYMLRKEGFEVAVATTGPDGLDEFERNGADLVLLDLMLPGLPGTEVCRQLRGRSNVPVIMVTAKDSEIDKVVGLEIGADDYVTKPFSSRELVARIRAVLRRRGEPEETTPAALEAGPVRMDVDRHVVTVGGTKIDLPLGVRPAGDAAAQRGPGADPDAAHRPGVGRGLRGDTKTLDVHVKRLRAKIEPDPGAPRYLVTVRGLGYKFEP